MGKSWLNVFVAGTNDEHTRARPSDGVVEADELSAVIHGLRHALAWGCNARGDIHETPERGTSRGVGVAFSQRPKRNERLTRPSVTFPNE